MSLDPACRAALERFGIAEARVFPLGTGLINQTYGAETGAGRFVLQRVSAIFDPAIHHNIRAVTERLAARGLTTPRLVLTTDGAPFARVAGGVWRLLTYVEGTSFDALRSAAQARAAGELLGRFHRTLEGLEHEFSGVRLGVHDTEAHLGALAAALEQERRHRLHAAVARLAATIFDAAGSLAPLPSLPPCIAHGDPKISNVLFAGSEGPACEEAVCLVDLDTVGPMPLAHELGDAWRSWCNPLPEDADRARFDMELFAASLAGYRAGRGRALSDPEQQALVGGVEWISLELAARFAGDALTERYFGWDRERFPGRGEHNLTRAENQLALHREVVASRSRRAELLALG